MKLLKKIRSSVLQFAILVSVLVALLLLSFISLTHTQKIFSLQSSHLIERIDTVKKALEIYLQDEGADPKNFSILNEVTITRSFWGGFELVSSSSNTEKISSTALVGMKAPKEKLALFLTEANNSLVLVGDSKIEGAAYLPQKGVKAGTISGKYFSGGQLIYGQIYTSESQLPPLLPEFVTYLKSSLSDPNDNDVIRTERQGEIKNSFNSKPLLIFDPTAIDLREKAIGNLIFKSKKEILVRRESSLEDVLLVAPIIRIQEGFTGRVHAVANDSIIIEKSVLLQYPSSLSLLNDTKGSIKNSSCIVLEDNSVVEGILIYLETDDNEKSISNLHISKEATLKGTVYCQGNLELEGTVLGSVYTRQFLVKGNSSFYLNHIMGGKILANSIPKAYCGLPIAKEIKGVAQWLY